MGKAAAWSRAKKRVKNKPPSSGFNWRSMEALKGVKKNYYWLSQRYRKKSYAANSRRRVDDGGQRPRWRVEGRLRPADQTLSRELDEMVAHDRAVDELRKASTAEHPPGHPPEGAAIVALHADAPEDTRKDAQPPPDTAGGEAARSEGPLPRDHFCVRCQTPSQPGGGVALNATLRSSSTFDGPSSGLSRRHSVN